MLAPDTLFNDTVKLPLAAALVTPTKEPPLGIVPEFRVMVVLEELLLKLLSIALLCKMLAKACSEVTLVLPTVPIKVSVTD